MWRQSSDKQLKSETIKLENKMKLQIFLGKMKTWQTSKYYKLINKKNRKILFWQHVCYPNDFSSDSATLV